MMRLIKSLLFTLLAFSLIIRPVFAEGLMLHLDSSNQSHEMHSMQMHQQMMAASNEDISHMNHSMDTSHLSSNSSVQDVCCEDGIHFCEADCSDGNCLIISSAPAFQTGASLTLFTVNQATRSISYTSDFISRTIQPELRPPLFNS